MQRTEDREEKEDGEMGGRGVSALFALASPGSSAGRAGGAVTPGKAAPCHRGRRSADGLSAFWKVSLRLHRWTAPVPRSTDTCHVG